MDNVYAEAAQKIKNCTFFVVGAGAGMSADSGLATYDDVSRAFEYLEKNNLTYRDLSNPDLLVKNPSLFFGWCGVCVEKYRQAVPHEGYSILKSWRDKFFSLSESNDLIRKEMIRNPLKEFQQGLPLPGSFFIYTTNVDKFFLRSGFPAEEICNTHGSYLDWQCSGLPKVKHPFKYFDKPCTKNVWPIPSDFEFQVDVGNLSAPVGPPKTSSTTPGWNTNHPTCPHCGQLQRPNVYNFGDNCFLENTVEETNRANWFLAVDNLLKNPQYSLVMLELGVGKRLPKLRVSFERLMANHKSNSTIIRINPEIGPGDQDAGVIPIKSGALEALQKINSFL